MPGQAPLKRLEREQSVERLHLGSADFGASAFKGVDEFPITTSHLIYCCITRNFLVAQINKRLPEIRAANGESDEGRNQL